MTGPERLAFAFRRCADEDRAALILFLAAGDPRLAVTVELARAAAEAGADVLELGVPFSDPLADGPVIQAAYARALAAGVNVRGVLGCAAEVFEATRLPLVLMSALNPVLAYGIEAFCRDAAAAGAAGLLVPDLPVEDAGDLRAACGGAGLATVFLAAPDSGPGRVTAAARASTGFVYLVRRRGVTGARGESESGEALGWARRNASVPVALGFGITTSEEAADAARQADGVVVGSALVRAAAGARARGRMGASDDGRDTGRDATASEVAADAVRRLVAELAAAVRTARRASFDLEVSR